MISTTAHAKVTIHAPTAVVWRALTDPQLVKQYMFGSNVVTDWKVGSSIVYRGEWKGQSYEDKGVILQIEPERKIVMTYFSPMSGKEDVPENYMKITYQLTPGDSTVELEIIQENNKDEAAAQQSTQNWQTILQELKKVAEAQ